MATGGTIPSNRTQTVSFYNTSGIIEKHKNIYFVPNDLGLSGTVNTAYLSKFEAVCPPSSFYKNMTLSSWSPQDRALFVKGNIDDFRLVTGEGDCLNYFIITRNVTKGEGQQALTETHYYAFFITGVEQAGGGSIKLSYEPDHFTNVFYLHNKDSLPQTDIFNGKLKNCHIKRQHYDRVKWNYENKTQSTTLTIGAGITESTVVLSLGNHDRTVITNVTCSNSNVTINSYTLRQRVVTITTFALEIYTGVTITVYYTDYDIAPDNEKIFLNQEESLRFKYQYRDIKYPLSLLSTTKAFTKTEMNTINSATSFSSLSSSLKTKIVKSCISYLAIEYKSYEVIGADIIKYNSDKSGYIHKSGGKEGDSLKRPNPLVIYPIVNIPKVFKKFNLNININGSCSYYRGNDVIYSGGIIALSSNLDEIINKVLNNSVYANYILGAYVIPYLPFEEYCSVSHSGTNPTVLFACQIKLPSANSTYVYSNYDYDTGLNVVGLLKPDKIGYDYSSKTIDNIIADQALGTYCAYPDGSYSNYCGGFIASGIAFSELSLTLQEKALTYSIKNNYIEPVLEAEPYSFYSLSYLSSNEIVFNKNRYYTGQSSSTLNFNIYVSVNGCVKLGVIPNYTVESKKTEYFNEGFSTIVMSNLPIISDSYMTYYYSNMSQMKNQYAVNDYNRKTDLIQHFLVSGPNSVGYSAGKGGMTGGGAGAGYSAILETGNQLSQMTDELIDWAQSTKVIEMNQKAIYADVGRKPDSLKQTGSDLYYDMETKENTFFLNHYVIDELSYNSLAKYLERFGYQVNLYDSLHTNDRVGWNYLLVNSLDMVGNFTVAEEEAIKNIFYQGVTMLHNKTYLTSGHNYETILDE